MYYKRFIDSELIKWKEDSSRKVLLLRGARQVGKSSAVRNLGKQFDSFVEINLEKDEEIRDVFLSSRSLDPKQLCEKISVIRQQPIVPGRTLLFFDEIQACIPALSSLRFFYEDYPELHVIAAGSLLEFALAELPSFGVGRIRSLFLYPFSFYEFLDACGHDLLRTKIQQSNLVEPLDDVLHRKAIDLLRTFLIIGGMPEVVARYAAGEDLYHCQLVLDDLINSLRSDFSKYKKRIPTLQVAEAFQSAVRQMGHKFVYSSSDQKYGSVQTKEAIELLIQAGLILPVVHTSGNGIPLGAEMNIKFRKMLLLDTGILQRLLGLPLADILTSNQFDFINRGNIAELYVGLELIKATSPYEMAQLYYWQREQKNAHAEVDYLLQKGYDRIPLEVKSGNQGKMQSLRLFLKEKNLPLGYRTSLENHAAYDNIRVIPLYAIRNVLNDKR